jgi:hypothetical protein
VQWAVPGFKGYFNTLIPGGKKVVASVIGIDADRQRISQEYDAAFADHPNIRDPCSCSKADPRENGAGR